ncbi:unnamed protein product [Polarella glacialis]|uniref:Uncharacterized protein n=1 Tax=Polarella glacialis TaxID=89957 RepID=A0A813ENZ3_POLGL|nr:unnamed protein product [Polarella glacialis]
MLHHEQVYPPHWNSGKEPNFRTFTDLKANRKATFRNEANALKIAEMERNPETILEPDPKQENMVSNPEFTSRKQRDAAWNRDSRARGGLDPSNSHIDPSRASMDPGLGYVGNPAIATRSGLRDERRQKGIEELEATRRVAETDYLPMNAQHTRVEYEEHELRRPNPNAMTANKLKDRRRRENIEHNMDNFPHREREPARYSDQEKLWWTMRETYVEEPPACPLKILRDSPYEKVSGKVTEQSLPPRRIETPSQGTVPRVDLPAAGEAMVPRKGLEMGGKTVKRWSTEFVPTGMASAAPRMFDHLDGYIDGVKQAATYSIDDAPLESFSSFEVIRESASDRQKDGSHHQASQFSGSETMPGGKPPHGPTSHRKPKIPEAVSEEFPQAVQSSGPLRLPAVKRTFLKLSRDFQKCPARRKTLVYTAFREMVHICAVGCQLVQRRETGDQDLPMTSRLRYMTARAASPFRTSDSPALGLSAAPPLGSQTARERHAYAGNRTSSAASALQKLTFATDAAATKLQTNVVVRTGGFQWLDSTNRAGGGASESLGPGSPSMGRTRNRSTDSALRPDRQPSRTTR